MYSSKRKRNDSGGGPGGRNSNRPTNNKNNDRRRNNKQNNANNPHQNQHRFGRVMSHPPKLKLHATSPASSTATTVATASSPPVQYPTATIAIPGSVVSNAQTRELQTQLAGQIARAAAVFRIDEIVVFDDGLGRTLKTFSNYARGPQRDRNRSDDHSKDGKQQHGNNNSTTPEEAGKEENSQPSSTPRTQQQSLSTDPHAFLARILQFCECPQYLRRKFFPMHPDLQFAGLLPPLDMPHHLRRGDTVSFREGVVVEGGGNTAEGDGDGGGSLVDCGVPNRLVQIDRVVPPGIRCTVKIDPKAYESSSKRQKLPDGQMVGVMQGTVVSPTTPRDEEGIYWGYTTRLASSISAIFEECPYEGGYDMKVGTSERGDVSIDDPNFCLKKKEAIKKSNSKSNSDDDDDHHFNHLLIVFGGVAGIEECVDADESMTLPGEDSKKLFDVWVNICPYQGSRTIRSEEALFIALARFSPFIAKNCQSSSKKKGKKEAVVPTADVEFSDESVSEESSEDDNNDDDDAE